MPKQSTDNANPRGDGGQFTGRSVDRMKPRTMSPSQTPAGERATKGPQGK